MNIKSNSSEEKDKTLKRDFKIAQYVYVGLYITLIICLFIFFT